MARLEFRETAGGMGTVAGTVIRYGDVATLPFGQERMLPGAFGDLSTAELYANRMHQRDQPLANTYAGLRIDDSAERLVRGGRPAQHQLRAGCSAEEVKTGRDCAGCQSSSVPSMTISLTAFGSSSKLGCTAGVW